MLSLVWFRRDLRVQDHPALSRAASEGPVLPVYIADPALLAGPDSSARHFAFLEESLRELREDLAAAGQPLILRAGDPVEVLARLKAKHRVTRIVTHPETGNRAARDRFAAVADWAREAGLEWLVLAEGQGAPLPVPVLEPVTEGTGVLPSARSLGLPEDPCPNRQRGGRSAGLAMLASYLATRGQGHAPGSATALSAERMGARLSPYLALGLISMAEIRATLAEARAERRGQPEWTGALRALASQLNARAGAHAAPLIQPEGTAATGPWAEGATGLPYVDAAMRALKATGWLDHRSRALLAAVGLHHLRLDPASVGLHLARLSTDYDPAIHWREIQRAAQGRIPDPVALGQKLDPDGSFLRRWLPELARIPDAHLHAPWLWPRARRLLAGRYPEPVLDPTQAAREARAIRARMAPVHEDDPLIEGPRIPRRRRPDGPQLSLDF
ncbi:deoxyribodipyrimidine photo-lyase [Cereibacter sphaeroides]|nr:deoxyribodipyrimidine photo-lyase [Cereibacter sphaeroides]